MQVEPDINEEEWDLVISSEHRLLNLHLHDVWNYRDLLWLLVRRDFVSFYKQTIFGPLWFFI
ncbi:MAG TPA: ABC transporter permease, partial [Chitinophagaceae bacterium]|nr:ABC transporter permease [Chitinophagaceae bacterium]